MQNRVDRSAPRASQPRAPPAMDKDVTIARNTQSLLMASTVAWRLPTQQTGPMRDGSTGQVFNIDIEGGGPNIGIVAAYSVSSDEIRYMAKFIAQTLLIQRTHVGGLKEAIMQSFVGMPAPTNTLPTCCTEEGSQRRLNKVGSKSMACIHLAAIRFLKERIMVTSTARMQTSNVTSSPCPFGEECIYHFYALFFKRLMNICGHEDSKIYGLRKDHLSGTLKMFPEKVNPNGCMCVYQHPGEGEGNMGTLLDRLMTELIALYPWIVALQANDRRPDIDDAIPLTTDIFPIPDVVAAVRNKSTPKGRGPSETAQFMGYAILGSLENASERDLFIAGQGRFAKTLDDLLKDEFKQFIERFADVATGKAEYVEERPKFWEMMSNVEKLELRDAVNRQPYYGLFNHVDFYDLVAPEHVEVRPLLSFYETHRQRMIDERARIEKENEEAAAAKARQTPAPAPAAVAVKVHKWFKDQVDDAPAGQVTDDDDADANVPPAHALAHAPARVAEEWPVGRDVRPRWFNGLAPRFVSEEFLQTEGFSFYKWVKMDSAERAGYVEKSIRALFSAHDIQLDSTRLMAMLRETRYNPYVLFDNGAVYGYLIDALESQ